MVNVTFDLFFDRPKVLDAIGKGKAQVLSRAGAYGRQVMRRLFRKRKKGATPGSPPNSHVGLLRDLTFFGYDSNSDSTVIGPQLIASGGGNPTVPEVLNDGGVRDGKTYHAFPFVQPTLVEIDNHFEGMFADSVH